MDVDEDDGLAPARPAARVAPRTSIPDLTDVPEPPRRGLGRSTLSAKFDAIGSIVAAICFTALVYWWFSPFTGAFGALVVGYLVFLGFYALLVSIGNDRRAVADKIMTVLMISAGVVLFTALAFVVGFALFRGADALRHLNFFTQTMEFAGPLDPLSDGGIVHAILGTLIQISIALAITVPLGILTAVFLNEVGGRFARFVRTISDAMTALPSIVAGLFVYASLVHFVTHQKSGFAASMAITVMMLPIVIRASDVVLRLVAGNLREASYALGANRWKTVWHVVLPTARSGLVTAVILGTARGIGETSPVLLTSGVTAVMNLNPFSGPMISLPLQVFEFVKSPEPNMIARGFGTAAALVLLVVLLFIVARLIGGRPPGVQSNGERRRAAERSRDDLQRMTAAAAAVSLASVSAHVVATEFDPMPYEPPAEPAADPTSAKDPAPATEPASTTDPASDSEETPR
ncbi:phosphate ABC transporter permease PstA [Schumannella soli]|uniref:Phosphate transport system permease protein PstA n=2 Tax=Schumannella soli TaxID=2590779 RepID=A0A506Y8A0_9MICO|nr:phosphate ABC transporter permease PstA [Schumannella soli]